MVDFPIVVTSIFVFGIVHYENRIFLLCFQTKKTLSIFSDDDELDSFNKELIETEMVRVVVLVTAYTNFLNQKSLFLSVFLLISSYFSLFLISVCFFVLVYSMCSVSIRAMVFLVSCLFRLFFNYQNNNDAISDFHLMLFGVLYVTLPTKELEILRSTSSKGMLEKIRNTDKNKEMRKKEEKKREKEKNRVPNMSSQGKKQ